jgi:putative oxidoreductase
VRRLFSNFASGWPALGLLLIRVVAGTVLIINGVMQVHVGQPVLPMLLGILAIGDGALLLAGLWTPLAGVLAAVLSTVDIIFRHENLYPGILLVAMGAGLTLVGPGAISIDSRIFGLRKIDLEKLDEPSRR